VRTIAMSFLPDVKVPCEACHGARFNPETLAVTWRGKNIGDVLQMEVDEAVEFFAAMPNISHPLQLLRDVGSATSRWGQPSPTLSGGEAQRIKLVTELSKVRDDITRRGQKAPHTLYVLDEPTVGLHMADVEKLIRVLHRLVDGGHSVVVIEHDLDVIAEADWIIDLGPRGVPPAARWWPAATPEDCGRARHAYGVALAPVLRAQLSVARALRKVSKTVRVLRGAAPHLTPLWAVLLSLSAFPNTQRLRHEPSCLQDPRYQRRPGFHARPLRWRRRRRQRGDPRRARSAPRGRGHRQRRHAV
jgi:energy-coupling factor transporter ATP-binding protein EcfA2